ncbi:Hpt domain-containing protein, partial [Spirochaetota bacterium]
MNKEEKEKILNDLGGISEEDFDRLHIKCVEEINKELDKLDGAFSKGDLAASEESAHAIKGAAGNFRM